ncbi:YeeE/YedE thiosulfate transporter family protein [Neptunomonas sp. XY-337]|uniref:YeeE/YedE thiosulfate transporter family protein n=1 Tax=Neptunomonas sp. XY-337 TaxID=2561897 RepID=UPI0010A9D9FC|nr:YeeE/YedE thiosulfate transporter family protein [Neptunomonas sp. XY-337]
MRQYWSWITSGTTLAICFLLAVILVKPIGVSTQFVIADGVLWSLFDDSLITTDTDSKSGYASTNAYLGKSGGKYAAAVENPINYSFLFVLAMIFGAWLASRFNRPTTPADTASQPVCRLGDQRSARLLRAFVGGAIVLFGARLAGGCTSGHMMSGMMQTSLSGYLFAAGAFAVAVPTAIFLYGRR